MMSHFSIPDDVTDLDQDRTASKRLLSEISDRTFKYRPLATRVPVLVLFAGLLTVYVVLIELLFHDSISYESSIQKRTAADQWIGRTIEGNNVIGRDPQYHYRDVRNWKTIVDGVVQNQLNTRVLSQAYPRTTAEIDVALLLPILPTIAKKAAWTRQFSGKHSLVQRDAADDESGSGAPPTSSAEPGFTDQTITVRTTITSTVIVTATIVPVTTRTITVTVTVSTAHVALRNPIHESMSPVTSDEVTHSDTVGPTTMILSTVSTIRGTLTRTVSDESQNLARKDVTSTETQILFVTTTEMLTQITMETLDAYLTLTVFDRDISSTVSDNAMQSSTEVGSGTSVSEPPNSTDETIPTETSQGTILDPRSTSRNLGSTTTNIELTDQPSLTSTTIPVAQTPQDPFSTIATGQTTETAMNALQTTSSTSMSSTPDGQDSSTITDLMTTPGASTNVLPPLPTESQNPSQTTTMATSALTEAYLVISSTVQSDINESSFSTKPEGQSTLESTASQGQATLGDTQTNVIATGQSTGTQTDTVISVPSTRTSTTSTVDGSSSATPWPIQELDDSEKVVNQRFTHLSYFAAIYLAPILAVIAKAYWEIIYSSFKMIEPFERLLRKDGFWAKDALLTQYLSCSIEWDAWKILLYKNPFPLFNLATYALVTTVSALAASSMRVQGMQNCPTNTGYVRCAPAWIIETSVLRSVEVILIVCIVLILLVSRALLLKRTIELPANPSSICSVAAIFNDEQLVNDLQAIQPDGNASMIEAVMSRHYVQLRYHEQTTGEKLYGVNSNTVLESSDGLIGDNGTRVAFRRKQNKRYFSLSNSTGNSFSWLTFDSWSLHTQSALLDAAQSVSTLAMFIMVAIYLFDSRSDPFNNFFNSNTWQASFVFSVVAVLVDIQWKRLEREVRITDPYRRLGKGNALPQNTILLSLHGTCWSTLPRTITNLLRYPDTWFQALVTCMAALSEFNIIAASTFAFNDGQTVVSVRVVGSISIAITALMTIVMAINVLWWRRETTIRNMPRCPDTIGVIFSYLCGSQMAREYSQAHFDKLDEKQRNTMIVSSGKRFRFGKKKGIDGVERWCIDFEDAWKPVSNMAFFEGLRLDLPESMSFNSFDRYV